MKFNHLIFVLIIMISSFKSLATIVAEPIKAKNTKMDPLNAVLANEKSEEEEEVAAIDDEQLNEASSEGFWERSNDPISNGSAEPEVQRSEVSSAQELEEDDL